MRSTTTPPPLIIIIFINFWRIFSVKSFSRNFFTHFTYKKTRPQLYYVAPWCLLHITMLYITTIILCSTVFCIFPFEKMYVAKKISFIFLKLHIQKKSNQIIRIALFVIRVLYLNVFCQCLSNLHKLQKYKY